MRASVLDRVRGASGAAGGAAEPAGGEGEVSGPGSGGGGILGKIGFWSSTEDEHKAAEDTASESAEETEKKPKRDNPKSSLGAIGEIMASQKKDGDGKKPS